MNLLTKAIETQLRNPQFLDGSPVAVCKFFNPVGGGTWIVSGFDPADDPDVLWCLADLGMGCCEEGTVSLAELVALRGFGGLGIERDITFNPKGRTLRDFYKLYETRGSLVGIS